MSLGSISYLDFKKRLCRPVEFKGHIKVAFTRGEVGLGGFDMNFFQVNIPTTFSSFMSLAGKKSMVHVLSVMPVMGILCLTTGIHNTVCRYG